MTRNSDPGGGGPFVPGAVDITNVAASSCEARVPFASMTAPVPITST